MSNIDLLNILLAIAGLLVSVYTLGLQKQTIKKSASQIAPAWRFSRLLAA